MGNYTSSIAGTRVTPTLDNWNISVGGVTPSVVSTQVPLSTIDKQSSGGQFNYATCLSTLPSDGLLVNIPFNSNLNDLVGTCRPITIIGCTNYNTNSINQGYSLDFSTNNNSTTYI